MGLESNLSFVSNLGEQTKCRNDTAVDGFDRYLIASIFAMEIKLSLVSFANVGHAPDLPPEFDTFERLGF